MVQAGIPAKEGAEPAIVGNRDERTLYVMWFPKLFKHPKQWDSGKAREACRSLFLEAEDVWVERDWDSFFTISVKYKEKSWY